MRLQIITILFFSINLANGQELQLHYDFRHTIDPKLNSKNFPLINFKYLKEIDTLGTGTFLFQVQSFLDGKKGNIGQTFFQVSQSLRFWKPKVYLSLNYTGGLGVTSNAYGYYIANSYAMGVGRNLVFPKTWLVFNVLCRYSHTNKPSFDPQFNFYIGGGLFKYKLMYSSSIVFWSPKIDNGLPENIGKKGRKLSFFGDPQIWYNLNKSIAIGSRISIYHHVLTNNDDFQIYPTIGIKSQF